MWHRFTERARRVVYFAQDEAGKLGEDYVSTEHLLLGLVRETDTVAARILETLGASPKKIKAEIECQVTRGDGRTGSDMQLTPRAKQVIDLANEEASQLNNNYIGTEHLLLGLVRESEGMAGRTLSKLGVEYRRVRAEAIKMAETSESQSGTEAETVEGTLAPTVKDIHNSIMNETLLRGRDLLSIADFSLPEVLHVFATARFLKNEIPRESQREMLAGKTLAMIFEKPSLRTRVTFEAGMTQLGGHAIYLGPQDAQIGKRETVADAARNLARWVDGVMARTFAHETVSSLAEHASIPVINGLSDLEHPCQAMADFLTIKEKKGAFEGLKLVYVGDGNNVCNSLMLLSAKLGVHFTTTCPEGYEPDEKIMQIATELAVETGARIETIHNPAEAVKDADAIYTDVWASMGQEHQAEERKRVFSPYQVNQELVAKAKDDVIVLHCLPAHRGEEITDEVLDGPHSVVVDEAENRLHVQKALLTLML